MNTCGRIGLSGMMIGLISGLWLWPSVSSAEDFKQVMVTSATAWGDYNNDGWSDLFGIGMLWTNNKDGAFTLSKPFGGARSIALGDYNNDGFLDVFGFVGGESGDGPRLWTNKGGKQWADDKTRFKPTKTIPLIHRAMTVGDFNGDGYLDSYVVGWCNPWMGPPEDDIIYTSNNGKSFTHTWTSAPDQHGRGVTTVDFDRDGDLDIYVSNYWMTPNFLWRNDKFDGKRGLTDVVRDPKYGLGDGPGHTLGSAIGDFNNDGEFDIFISNFAHPGNPKARLMMNRGRAGNYHFTDKGICGIKQVESLSSAATADFDNDGHLDLFITVVGGYGAEKAQLYRNHGNWTFRSVTASVGLGGLRSSKQGASSKACWGDFNNDGFLDLVADGKLWKNPGKANWPDHHYLKVKLVGGKGPKGFVNGSAIGAQVRIKVPGLGTLSRQVAGNTGVAMQNDLVLHFGLGKFSGRTVDLEILWPGGSTQKVKGVAVDQTVVVNVK